MKNISSAFLILLLGIISCRSMAQCNFFLPDASNFNRVGKCSVSNYTYTLAGDPNWYGAAWYRDSADLSYDFDISFSTYQCGTTEGMVFVLQSCSNGLEAAGGNVSGLGYYLNPSAFVHSLGVELDSHNGGFDSYDEDDSHIAITRDGEFAPVVGAVHISPAINNCGNRTLRLTWNAGTQLFSVYLDDTLRTSYTADLVNDVLGGNPHVYFGVTAGSGPDYSTQQFSVNYLHYHSSHSHSNTVAITSTSQCNGGSLAVSPGARHYLWSTGDTSNIIYNTQAGTYTVAVTDMGGCTQSAQYTVGVAPGDPAVFGNHVWNIYAWNAGNSSGTAGAWGDNYSGYLVDTNLTLITAYKWIYTPSDASGYHGCAVSADHHSWSAKRKGFNCGIYQLNIPYHAYEAQLLINGNQVWEHGGCCDYHPNVWTGFLDNNSTVEFRVSTGGGGSAGYLEVLPLVDLITSNGPPSICPGYSVQLTAPGTEGHFLWSTGDTSQSTSVNTTGTYSISITSGSCTVIDSESITVQPIPTPVIQVIGPNPAYSCAAGFGLLVENNYSFYTYHWSNGVTVTGNGTFYTGPGDYTVTTTDELGCVSDTSATMTLFTIPPPGDPAVFGDHVWNEYTWQSTNWTDNYRGYLVFSQDYPDAIYYISNSKWSAFGNPTGNYTFQGCAFGSADNFSWSAKRRGFPSNIYQLSIEWHDDDAELYINGSLVWSATGAASNVGNVWTGCLNENSTVEFRVKEFGGDAIGQIKLTPQYTILTTNGPPTICPGFSETVTALNGANSYLWNTGDTTQSISVSDSGTYTVTANMNGCPLTDSRTIHVAPIPTPSINVYGMNPYYVCNTPPSLQVSAPISYHTYTWNNESTGSSMMPAGIGDYTVVASDVLGCVSDTSAVLALSTIPPPGDPTVFGDHVWKVYAYSSGNASADSTLWQPSAYAGYYVDGNFNFDSNNSWWQGWSPSTASGYDGCEVPYDNHSWSAKRKGFPCSIYRLDVPGHDDEAQLFIDGVMVWNHDGAGDAHTNVWTGWLNDSSEVEFRVTEGGGDSYGSLTLNAITYYADADGDGFGDPAYALSICNASTTGYVGNNLDCNDTDASINPGAGDALFDGIDNNCNGSVDESCYSTNQILTATSNSTLYRAPNARYKYGRSVYLLKKSELATSGLHANDILELIGWNNVSLPGLAATGTLKLYLQNTTDSLYTKPFGLNAWTTSIGGMSVVYNDTATLPAVTGFWNIDISDSAFKYTGNGLYVATEWINCGTVSNGVSQQVSSGSGLAAAASHTGICNPSTTLSSSSARPATRFSSRKWWYHDADGDGFATDSVLNCSVPNAGWVSYAPGRGDCNDNNPLVNSAATEICNSIDDNCDGVVDENGFVAIAATTDPVTFCDNGIAHLTAAPEGAGYSYQWSNESGAIVGATSATYAASGTGDYHVTISLGSCAVNSNAISIAVNPAPVATITPPDAIISCKFVSYTLTANAGAGLTYQWFKNSLLLSGATNSTYTTNGTQAGNFKVLEKNSFGCATTSNVVNISRLATPAASNITVVTPADNPDLCINGKVKLRAVGSSTVPLGYQWYNTGGIIAGATDRNYTTTSTGTYTVKVTNLNTGCSNISSPKSVISTCKTGDNFSDGHLNIYPNPTNGHFVIDLETANEDGEAMLQIFNALGQSVMAENVAVVNGKVLKETDLDENAAAGIYFVRIVVNDQMFSSQVVFER